MAIPSRQIGWGTESNLLWQILKQLTRLTSIMFSLKPNYKVYTVLLSQSEGTAPFVNSVLEDTINESFIFSYTGQGDYKIESPIFNAENLLKISITLSQSVEQRIVNINSAQIENGWVDIYSNAPSGGKADSGIFYATLEIRLYN